MVTSQEAKNSLYSKIFTKTNPIDTAVNKNPAPSNSSSGSRSQSINPVPNKTNPLTNAISKRSGGGSSRSSNKSAIVPATDAEVINANTSGTVTELGNRPIVSSAEIQKMQSSQYAGVQQTGGRTLDIPTGTPFNEAIRRGELASGLGANVTPTKLPSIINDRSGVISYQQEVQQRKANENVNRAIAIEKRLKDNPESFVGEKGFVRDVKITDSTQKIGDTYYTTVTTETSYGLSPEYYNGKFLTQDSPVLVNASSIKQAKAVDLNIGYIRGVTSIGYGIAEYGASGTIRTGKTIGSLSEPVKLPRPEFIAKYDRVPMSTSQGFGYYGVVGGSLLTAGLSFGNVIKTEGFVKGTQTIARIASPISITPNIYTFDISKEGTFKARGISSEKGQPLGNRYTLGKSKDTGFNDIGLGGDISIENPSFNIRQNYRRIGDIEAGSFMTNTKTPALVISGNPAESNFGTISERFTGTYFSNTGTGNIKFSFGGGQRTIFNLPAGQTVSLPKTNVIKFDSPSISFTDRYLPSIKPTETKFSGGVSFPTENKDVFQYYSGGLKGGSTRGGRDFARYEIQTSGKEYVFNPENNIDINFGSVPNSYIAREYGIPKDTPRITSRFSLGKGGSSRLFSGGSGSVTQLAPQVQPSQTSTFSEKSLTSIPSLYSGTSVSIKSESALIQGFTSAGDLLTRTRTESVQKTFIRPMTISRISSTSVTTDQNYFRPNTISDIGTVNIIRTPSILGSSSTTRLSQITIPQLVNPPSSPNIFSPSPNTTNTSNTFFIPPFKLPPGFGEDIGSRPIRGKKRRSKYTPSFDALLFNIRGKQPKGIETGLRTRPIPKGYKWSFGRLRL